MIVVRGAEQDGRAASDGWRWGSGDPATSTGVVRFGFRAAEVRGSAPDAVRAWHSPAHEHVDHPLLADDAGAAAGWASRSRGA
ncbi:hypothetical protein ACFWOL_10555 [Streptomyces sp. NPDC058442]|uniref:hypothetical protein n=1 Tax=Streptomyces sp. NPDC058442 TaxID=3346503 RepID=UPI0036512E06